MFALPEVELDLSRFQLRRAGRPVKLEKQPLELLILLVERRESLVTREEIAAHLWQNNHVHVDVDQSIHSAMRKIRVALEDDSQAPRFIETVVGKGYRFIGPIRVTRREARPLRRLRIAMIVLLVSAVAACVTIGLRRVATAHQANRVAREAYLRGVYFQDKRTADALRKSISYYRLAIKADPKFAPARERLADSLPEASNLAGEPVLPVFDEALASGRVAIALDPDLGEAHATYGWLLAIAKWRWREARAELERAVHLSPNSAYVHLRYAMVLIASGNTAAAIREASRAHDLDPVSLYVSRTFAQFLFLGRRYEESMREFRRAEELDPRNPVTARCLDNVLQMQGKPDDAVIEDLKFLDREGLDPMLIEELRAAWRNGGARGYWSRSLELPLPAIHKNAWVRAIVAARVGRSDDALHLLDRAVARHELWATWLRVDPLFDSIRYTSGYGHLLRRMNLPPL